MRTLSLGQNIPALMKKKQEFKNQWDGYMMWRIINVNHEFELMLRITSCI